jgi:FlaG/FlaF family flagellin (archaellin)
MGDLPTAMKYDYQLVLALVPGGREMNDENRILVRNAEHLMMKRKAAGDGAKTRVVYLTGKFGSHQYPNLASLRTERRGPRLRVYVVGHGDGESSEISDLKAEALAAMLETLGTPITVLGLVACYAGLEDLMARPANGRPTHSLATSLYARVRGVVTEIHAHTGEGNLKHAGTTHSTPVQGSVQVNHPDRGLIYMSKLQVWKDVTQQTTSSGRTIPRKMVHQRQRNDVGQGRLTTPGRSLPHGSTPCRMAMARLELPTLSVPTTPVVASRCAP